MDVMRRLAHRIVLGHWPDIRKVYAPHGRRIVLLWRYCARCER